MMHALFTAASTAHGVPPPPCYEAIQDQQSSAHVSQQTPTYNQVIEVRVEEVSWTDD